MSVNSKKDSHTGSKPANDEYDRDVQASRRKVDTIPPPNANSAEVRQYLATILKGQHGLLDEEVSDLASRWVVGRGHELRSYTAQMYIDIFGRDIGWVLYRDIQLEVNRKRRKSRWETHGVYIAPCVSFTLTHTLIQLIIHGVNQRTSTVAALLSEPSFLLLVVTVYLLVTHLVDSDHSEKQIERELRGCSFKETTSTT